MALTLVHNLAFLYVKILFKQTDTVGNIFRTVVKLLIINCAFPFISYSPFFVPNPGWNLS